MNVFEQQANFMETGGQTTGIVNLEQASGYFFHILEEADELEVAYMAPNHIKLIDGATDLIVVAIGLLHSLGVDPKACWDAVYKANMSKFVDGKPVYREDGQISKGPGFVPPEAELEKIARAAGLIP